MSWITSFSAKNVSSTLKKFTQFNVTLPPRLRGGFIENSVNYIRNVYTDYKTVYFDTLQDIRNRPFRASIIGSILLSGAYCIGHNPTQDDFQDQLIEYNNQLSRVPDSIRNKTSLDYVHGIFRLNNKELLRHQSLGLFSIIYRVDCSRENDLFQNQCLYLKPSFKNRLENIIDIGFLNRFWILHYKMKNYDINEEEWIIQQ